ncbi:MAG: DNA gyrase C-terminal beta-propeller domain-containing protein, partial [Actinomycetaceae bacterium]|nr:DNA gyrase C-terminal beta-propeller domain-containing protein [Actinomycetaceae bacterium]
TPGSVKTTPLDRFPAKGRGTGGVRAQRFLKGEDILTGAWVTPLPPRAVGANGGAVNLPDIDERRDASGTLLSESIISVG